MKFGELTSGDQVANSIADYSGFKAYGMITLVFSNFSKIVLDSDAVCISTFNQVMQKYTLTTNGSEQSDENKMAAPSPC